MNARAAVLDLWRGFSRPFTLLAGLRSHPESWRRFRRTIASQLALTAAIAGLVLAFKDGPTREDEPDAQPKDRAALARAFVAEFSDGGVELQQLVRSLDDREERDETTRLTQVLEQVDDLELKPLARTLGVEGQSDEALARRLRQVLQASRDGGLTTLSPAVESGTAKALATMHPRPGESEASDAGQLPQPRDATLAPTRAQPGELEAPDAGRDPPPRDATLAPVRAQPGELEARDAGRAPQSNDAALAPTRAHPSDASDAGRAPQSNDAQTADASGSSRRGEGSRAHEDDDESAEAVEFLAVLRSADARDGGVELGPLVPFLSTFETRATDAEVNEALDEFARAEKRKPSSHPRAWLAWLFSALVFGQWVTLAFTREYQEPLARALCEVAAIEPEDDERAPRVRVDFKWLRKKLMQRLRGLLVLLPGFLVFVPVLFVTLPFGLDDYVMPPLMFSWSAYWWCAFTVGRSARAWRDEAAQVPPLPVRWWLARTEDTFGMRWFLPRWVGRFAVWATKRDAAPAVALERAPWVFIGLGLARLITSPPLLRLVFRAPIDMAAADALEHAPPRA